MHKLKPDGVPALRGGSGHGAPSLKKLPAINTLWQRKTQFSPLESHRVYYSHLMAGTMSRSSWSTQDELNGISIDFLTQLCFVWAFFALLVFGLF